MADLTVWWALVGDTDPARELLVRAVAQHLEVAPSRVRIASVCPVCRSSEHGRPIVAEPAGTHLHLSLSRAPGLVAVAVTEAGPVGVDLEEVARTAFAGFAAVALHPDERAGTSAERGCVWTRKEAFLKAVGTGVNLDPREVRMSGPHEPAALREAPVGLVTSPVWIEDLPLPPGFAGATAVLARTRPRLRLRRVGTARSARPA
ncbi:MAG: 4'-phosphopantetheinyl transferase superfamily protein [Actinomycetota bacterium]|nr:4'-phosphopantetheinyl transferase superfamily protein [Actinomycetota bacterium]